MLAYISLALAFVAAAIIVGGFDLSVGHWPGISLGLAAALAGVLELRSLPRHKATKMLAWMGLSLGLLAALLGIVIYLGWGFAAGRVG